MEHTSAVETRTSHSEPGYPGGLAPRFCGAWTGEEFVASLSDGREVWYDGRKVDVTEHPSFSGLLSTLRSLYDAQHEVEHRATTLWVSPRTERPISVSYLLPTTEEELERKWACSDFWMARSYGQLPRLPDFMANVVVGLFDFRRALGAVNPQFEENAVRYYEYCRDYDLCLTHGLGDPQIDRSASPLDNPDYALRVVERSSKGIVVRGAKQLATLAPYSHEALIYLSPAYYARERPEYVAWFAVPMSAPGLRMLCRESHAEHANGFSHTLSTRYDEQDAVLFFDDVFVPIERVFLLDDTATAARGFHELNKWSLYVGHIRFYHRLRTFLGVASLIAKSIGVSQFREIENRLGELTSYVEMIRLALVGMNAQLRRTDAGLLAPGSTLAADAFAAQISARIGEIVRVIGGSGIVMQPSENDLAADELRPLLDRYLCGKDVNYHFKARLQRIAFELVAGSYGMRQELYELWNRGDIVRSRAALYRTYPDREACERSIRSLIESGTSGW